MRRVWAWLAALLLLALPLVAAYFLISAPKAGLSFRAVSFEDLPGWHKDLVIEALPALQKSCDKILSLPPERRLPGARIGGTAGDWQEACRDIMLVHAEDALRHILESRFTPLEVSVSGKTEGTFTGYYETLLHGSRTQSARYHIPLYARPDDLVSVDLGTFRTDLKGRRIAGRVVGHKLVPYADREAIEDGALKGRDLEILWVDNPIDAFFLQIQGSGRVQMEDGSLIRVGYAGQNGHPYYAIGRKLIADGEIAPEHMSMQAIRTWLKAHPDQMDDVMNTNPSFVFFRLLDGTDGPYGSAGVPLTARRSLAVDRVHLPLDAPVWLATSYPAPDSEVDEPGEPFERLMVAQDTGGAINGEIRGDVFWGFGDEAEAISGRMNNAGRYWLLLPKALAVRAVETGS